MPHCDQADVAVLIPCHNEEITIGKVIDDFRAQLPLAKIYVFDNCSRDKTAALAAAHGASVIYEPRQGKGFVVDRMFSMIVADYYVMVDGDDTYDAKSVAALLEPVIAGNADMVVGARLADYGDDSFRPMHVAGNKLVKNLVNWMGRSSLTDIMSGYRAFNRNVIQRIPVVSSGFEIETELTIQMLYYRMKIIEVPVNYNARPPGSQSKLRTVRDGLRVLWKIFSLLRAFKPLTFFGSCGIVIFLLGMLAGIRPVHDYFANPDHFVEHVPLAILASALVLLAAGCVFLGVLLHAINWRFYEIHNVLTRKQNA
jgi:glycosyltransferase involved in cell wall biosynthesis